MANQALPSPQLILDANGLPVPGAQLFYYQSGTLTLIPVYSDSPGAIAATNPVIADGNGMAAQTYVNVVAKVVVKDAAGATLYTLDPTPVIQSTGSGASQISFNPIPLIPAVNVQAAIELVDASWRAASASLPDAYQPLDPDLIALASISGINGDIIYRAGGAWARLPVGAAGTSLQVVSSAPAWGSPQVMIVADEKTAGTNGGTASSGSFTPRTLNTVRTNTITGASLATNQITLPAGTYRINASAPALRVNGFATRLQNMTDTTTAIVGSAEFSEQAGAIVQARSSITGVITIAAPKAFELQMHCNFGHATVGFGQSFNVQTEVYSIIEIEKIG